MGNSASPWGIFAVVAPWRGRGTLRPLLWLCMSLCFVSVALACKWPGSASGPCVQCVSAFQHVLYSTSLFNKQALLGVNISDVVNTAGSSGFSIAFRFSYVLTTTSSAQKILTITTNNYVQMAKTYVTLVRENSIGSRNVNTLNGNFADGSWNAVIYSVSWPGLKISLWINDFHLCDNCGDYFPVASLTTTLATMKIGFLMSIQADFETVSVYNSVVTPTDLCVRPCAPGTYREEGNTCVQCAPGKHSFEIGATSPATCRDCVPAYQSITDAVSLSKAYLGIPVNILDIQGTPNGTGFSIAFQFKCTQSPSSPSQNLLLIAPKHYVRLMPAEIRLGFQNDAGGTSIFRVYGDFANGNWHAVIYSVSSDGAKISLWINGMLTFDGRTSFLPVTTLATTATSMRIGTDTTNTIDYQSVSLYNFLVTPMQLCPTPCVAGTYRRQDATGQSCVQCASGKFSQQADATSNATCVDCVSGKYTLAAGSSICLDCSPGTYSPPSASACTACDAGKFHIATTDKCTPCPVDSYSIAGSDAQADCTCNSGYTGTDGGACTACEAGKFHIAATDTCIPCTRNSHSIAGSVAQTDCTCNRGYTGTDGSACTACESGKYTSASGNTPCEECPAMYSASSLTDAHANRNPAGCLQFV